MTRMADTYYTCIIDVRHLLSFFNLGLDKIKPELFAWTTVFYVPSLTSIPKSAENFAMVSVNANSSASVRGISTTK